MQNCEAGLVIVPSHAGVACLAHAPYREHLGHDTDAVLNRKFLEAIPVAK